MNPSDITTSTGTEAWRRLFDVGAIGRLLADHPRAEEWLGTAPYEVRVERYWPQGAPQIRGLQAEWSVRSSSGEINPLFGQQRLDGKPLRFKLSASTDSSDPLPGTGARRGVFLWSGDSRLLIHSPECDPVLRQLAACLNAPEMGSRLGAFGFHGHGSTAGLHCRLAGYRANRRAAIRYRFEPLKPNDPSLLGKTFRDLRGRGLIQRHILVSEALRRVCGTRVRVPAPIGFDEALRLALFFWMPGPSLDSLPHDGARWMECVVEALAAVHELRLSALPTFGAADEANIVRRWGNALAHAAPESHATIRTVIERLLELSGEIRTRHPRVIHRDFYEKQVVAGDDSITVLDLDTLSIGDASVDVGNLLAHLFLKSLQQGEDSGRYGFQAAALLNRYEERCGRLDRTALGFFTASAFFRLGAVHTFRSTTGNFVPRLWSAARALLGGDPPCWDQTGIFGKAGEPGDGAGVPNSIPGSARPKPGCCVRGAA